MTALQTPMQHPHAGLRRSAALMRALGSNAQPLWERLTPSEARQLSTLMKDLPEATGPETEAIEAYLGAMPTNPEIAPVHPQNIWTQFAEEDPSLILTVLERESPQIIAVILSKISHEHAARLITAMPKTIAVDVLKRLLYLGEIQPSVFAVLETQLQNALTAQSTQNQNGHERVARIFDQVDSKTEETLLFALDDIEPGARDKVRSLMFTFEDLSALDPASLQTLLSNIERGTLIMALKGASEQVTQAFLSNMTQRAGQVLSEDIINSGPIRRSEIEAARNHISGLARALIKRGDILSQAEDDELVE